MIDTSKTPYLELEIEGDRLSGRTLACELSAGISAPRATGWMMLDNRDGAISSAAKGAAIRLLGGRRGGTERTILTGTIPRDPRRGAGARKHELRVELADGWAAADEARAVQTLMDVTPQEVLELLLGLAGIADKRLTLLPFIRRHHVVLNNVNLAGAVRQVAKIWEPEEWMVGFEGDGTFYWESRLESPAALAPPAVFLGGDLTELEREDDGTGRAGMFFAPELIPGGMVVLLEETGRITWRRHFFDGKRFRTEIRYGPLTS